jgi:hypothetical protein
MKKDSRIYIFGYFSIICFVVLWEITDKIWYSLALLIGTNIFLIFLKTLKLIPIEQNRDQNTSLLPLYYFFKENIIYCTIFCFSLMLIQVPMDFPIKNWGLTVFGKEKVARIINDDTFIEETERGDIEVNFQTAEFSVNGKKYLSYYEENWIDLSKKDRIIIQYLPINPKVNKFRDDYKDNSDPYLKQLISLLISITLPCFFFYYLEKKSNLNNLK